MRLTDKVNIIFFNIVREIITIKKVELREVYRIDSIKMGECDHLKVNNIAKDNNIDYFGYIIQQDVFHNNTWDKDGDVIYL